MLMVMVYQNGNIFVKRTLVAGENAPSVGDEVFMGYNPPVKVVKRIFTYEKNGEDWVSVVTNGLEMKK